MKRVKLPKQVWPLYRSAVVHTHKAKPPLKVILMIVIPLIVVPLAFYKFFTGFKVGGNPDAEQVEPAQPLPAVPASLHPGQANGPTYQIDWGEAFTPDIKGLPFTAPIYRDQAMKPASVPVIHGCMSMETDFSDCTCYTQQGTKIHGMPFQMCLRALKDGIFNHLSSSDEKSLARDSAERRGTSRAGDETSL